MRWRSLPLFFVLGVVACGGGGASANPPKIPEGPREFEGPPSDDVEGEVTSADGVSIHYRARAIDAPSVTVVFVHCWTCTSENWEHAAVRLEHRGYRVITLDLAGHGKSGKNRATWSMEAFGADVRAVVEKLSAKNVVLVGHSMGGAVIIEAARAMPDRVTGLIAIDTLSNLRKKPDPAFTDSMAKKLEADFPNTVEQLARTRFPKDADPAVVKKVIDEMRAADPKIAIPIFRAMFDYDAGARMAEVKAPLRAIESDMHPTDVEGNRTIAPGFDAVIMPNVGHWPMFEAPDRFDQALETTLASLTK